MFCLINPLKGRAQCVNQATCLCVKLQLYPNAPYFIILLCLMSDDITCEGESAGAQWAITLD
jgi:hypothetical protein